MATKALPSQEVLRQLLDYDPETGVFRWRARPVELFSTVEHRTQEQLAHRWNSIYKDKPALQTLSNGYFIGRIFSSNCRAHRVAWVMFYGLEPNGQIDHVNGDKTDNRIANLRVVDAGGNARNRPLRSDNKSGANGVQSYCGKWRAGIRFQGKLKHLGTFNNFEEAVKARQKVEEEMGFHKNHGRAV